jgi:hypothetical protein
MKKELVVARFNESLDWLKGMPWPSRVYDKSAGDLPNIGFEAHTFLHHFAGHYDELAEVTVCLQGNPDPHCRNLQQAIMEIDPGNFSFMPIARHGSWQHPDGMPHHRGLGHANERLWRLLKGCPPPGFWYSWYGGQFAVHRDRVRRYSREFWAEARDAVVTKDDACAMERLWGSLFP